MWAICFLILSNIFHHILSNTVLCNVKHTWTYVTYMLNNKNYNTCFLTICLYRICFKPGIRLDWKLENYNLGRLQTKLQSTGKYPSHTELNRQKSKDRIPAKSEDIWFENTTINQPRTCPVIINRGKHECRFCQPK